MGAGGIFTAATQTLKETAKNWYQIEGNQMIDLLQQKCGNAKAEAERDVEAWFARL